MRHSRKRLDGGGRQYEAQSLDAVEQDLVSIPVSFSAVVPSLYKITLAAERTPRSHRISISAKMSEVVVMPDLFISFFATPPLANHNYRSARKESEQ